MSSTPSIQITTPGGMTNAGVTSLSGTATGLNFGMVEVYDNGIYVAPAGVFGGHWSSTVLLNQGDNSYTVTGNPQTDPGVTSAPVVLTDVQTLPTVTLAQIGGYTNTATQTLSGTATTAGYGTRFTAGTALALFDNGIVVGHAQVATDGTWSTTVTLLTQGRNFISISDTDSIGNEGAADTFISLKTTVPAVAITSPGGVVNNPQQVISGTATASDVGDTVTVSRNGSAIGTATVGFDGSWSLAVTMTEGSNSFQARDADQYGNIGTSGTVNYTLDTLPPAVAITSGATSVHAASDTETVTGTAEVGSTVTVFDDGAAMTGAAVAADGTWSAQVWLRAGPNGLSAKATDAAGNVGVSNTVVDTLNTTPVFSPSPTPPVPSAPTSSPAPTPPVVAFGPVPQFTGGTTATLSGTVSDAVGITGIEILDGSSDLGPAQVNPDGTWTFAHDFGQGSYDHLTAVATDPAGLSKTASALYDLVTGVPGRRPVVATTTTDASGAVTAVTTLATDGSVGAQTVANGDGTATSTGYANGQSLLSIGNDVMTGNGYRENFVFQPTMGHARITDFVASGAGHDTITLSHQDFDTIAQVLAHTTMNNGSAVIHVTPDDTIRLAGVTKADLIQHRGDFAFTS